MVLVDTSVWSLALRRQQPPIDGVVAELQHLIQAEEVQMIGPIRQELLSGIREQAQFVKLRDHLRAFPDLPLTTNDFEQAADFFNTARKGGIQGSNTDFLICAVAARYDMTILTTDNDFGLYQTHLPIKGVNTQKPLAQLRIFLANATPSVAHLRGVSHFCFRKLGNTHSK